ncbi:MAG: cation transporter [Chloroflexi bacterium]|nr:MAG: cation transporter [Chloroflexota bacterium]
MTMEFRALRVPTLTEKVAGELKATLDNLSGIEEVSIILETQELSIKFDENQLGFQTLAEKLASAGCSLRNIDAALLL